MKISKTVLTVTMVATIIGIAGFAIAHGEYGYRGDHMGYGDHMGRGYGMGMRMGYVDDSRYSDMTDEQAEKIGKARADFLEATDTLRNDIYQKRLELRSELAKQDPDTGELKSIQKELSTLEADLDQKHLAYEIERNKVIPEGNRGVARRGFGRSFGGPCWE